MIKSEMLPLGEITKQLDKKDKVAIITCNNCARICGIGGVDKADEVAAQLQKEGYNVVSVGDTPVACNFEYYKDVNVDGAATAIAVLSCPVGLNVVSQVYEGKKIVKCAEGQGAFVLRPSMNRLKVEEVFAGKESVKGTEYTILTGAPLKDQKM
ncbi:MAG: hypothetical protein ACI3ZR_04255 [bacterium]